MRTLKKSLALVLALVMVLGLGVIGASADNALDNYTDASEIGDAYYEAVGVLTGLGIIDGMTETTIEPTGTYTREQAAKIIATMVLGVKNAESLTCVEAPFDDVPADRWSAGYIAFCVEQGIIDGMTDTTFEPTGTLTGFQWAKMLLAAVGFGANGEFTGTSWSLNTARVAHEAGLFDGDLSGADHVNLSRQQAALYAFNTLTEIKQVTYTSNANNYVYGIGGYWFADGTGHTLGDKVFDLDYVEGIVTDNEATGLTHTKLEEVSNQPKSIWNDTQNDPFYVKADTGLDLLQHAVRVWFTGKETGVFTYDLAKATVYTCGDISDAKDDYDDLEDNKTAVAYGHDSKGDALYAYAVIDNSAYTAADYDYYAAEYWVYLGKMGGRTNNLSKDKVNIDNEPVEVTQVKTDISEIDKRDTIIVLKDEATDSTKTHKTAYHVWPVSSTSGAVTSINSKNVITLSDGTKLEPSALFDSTDTDTAAALAILEWALDNDDIVSPNFTFVLDTHGHYITLTNTVYRTVAYFTTAQRNPNYSENWSTDQEYEAQFVDVATGDIEVIPVSATWYEGAKAGGYYDITDELNGNETYYPISVPLKGVTYGDYVFMDNQAAFKSGTQKVENGNEDVYFDNESVTFVIARGAGNSLDVDVVTGTDGLIESFQDYYNNSAIKQVNLAKMVALTVDNDGSTNVASVIFAYDGNLSAEGGVIFFPEANGDWELKDNDYYRVPAYVNGSDEVEMVKVEKEDIENVHVGFYSFTIDNDGYCKLHRLADGDLTWGVVDGDNGTITDLSSTKYLIQVNGAEYSATAETPVIDLRDEDNRPSTINSMDDLCSTKFNEFPNETVRACFVADSDANILYVYVVEKEVEYFEQDYTVEKTDNNDDYSVTTEDGKFEIGESVTLTLEVTGNEGNWKSKEYDVTYAVNGVEKTVHVVLDASTDDITIEVDAEMLKDAAIDDEAVAITVVALKGNGTSWE